MRPHTERVWIYRAAPALNNTIRLDGRAIVKGSPKGSRRSIYAELSLAEAAHLHAQLTDALAQLRRERVLPATPICGHTLEVQAPGQNVMCFEPAGHSGPHKSDTAVRWR